MSDRVDRRPAPFVSVVIPSYNRADLIAETLESVLQQTYRDLEIIVIDDGSTDGTRRVVEPFVRDNVRYVWQENAERAASRNHGLRLASGEFIAFLDSDDLWLPFKVARHVEILRANSRIGLVYSDFMQIEGDGTEVRSRRAGGRSGRVTGALLRRNFIPFSTHLARTALVREIGGFCEDRQLSGAEDWEMCVRLSLRTEFAYDPVVTTKIRTHSGNTMTNAAAMARSMKRALELFQGSDELRAYRTSFGMMAANVALVNAINRATGRQPALAMGDLRTAMRNDPRILFDLRFGYTVARLLRQLVG